MNKYQVALNNICLFCEKTMSKVLISEHKDCIEPHNCEHQECPFKTIDYGYCDDYDTLQELINISSKKINKGVIKKAYKTIYCEPKWLGNDLNVQAKDGWYQIRIDEEYRVSKEKYYRVLLEREVIDE